MIVFKRCLPVPPDPKMRICSTNNFRRGYTRDIIGHDPIGPESESLLMSYDDNPTSPVFRIDVSAESDAGVPVSNEELTVGLLRQLVVSQQQQTKLLTELVQQNAAMHKQRAGELQQWKDANPQLSRACRRAAETLSEVQTEFLQTLTEEIDDSGDHLVEGEYMLNEFIDRFGPRMAHLNGILQVLAQLGTGEPIAQQQQH